MAQQANENPVDHFHASKLYANVTKLYSKYKEPGKPTIYREIYHKRDERYILLHEEEQHLADGLAFLAQTEAGPYTVSAVTLEQESNPLALKVRLAANKTPSEKAVAGLKDVLAITSESAIAGRDSKAFEAKLLTCVVAMSKERLLGRIQSRYRKKSWPRKRANMSRPLYLKIDELVSNISTVKLAAVKKATEKLRHLKAQLSSLQVVLKAVDDGSPGQHMELLATMVKHCFIVSHNRKATSLEIHLRLLGLNTDITTCRTVLEIDKIASYYGIVKELICLSRRPDSQELFSNIRLESLGAPPALTPQGASLTCRVHGEVQLVLFHARFPSKNGLEPRTIGSSKLACFLCHLFVVEYGSWSISGSHGRLYERWRIPWGHWIQGPEVKRLQGVVVGINNELQRLITQKMKLIGPCNGPESRVHLLLLPHGTKLPSPAASILSTYTTDQAQLTEPIQLSSVAETPPNDHLMVITEVEEIAPEHERDLSLHIQALSVVASADGSMSTIRILKTDYSAEDLPLEIIASEGMQSCWLVYGKMEYLIDVQNLDHGIIHISGNTSSEQRRINARDLGSREELELVPLNAEETLSFVLHEHDENQLLVEIRWAVG